MPGLLDSLATNPMLGLGAGLLSAAGPTTSPYQASLGAGLNAGLNNLLQMQQLAAHQQYKQALIQAQMQDLAIKSAEARRKREALEALPPEMRAAAAVHPGVLSQFYKQEAPSSSQRDYEFAVKQGYKGSFMDWKRDIARAGASNVTQISGLPGGLPEAFPPELANLYGLNPEQTTGLGIDPKTGKPFAIPEHPTVAARRAQEQKQAEEAKTQQISRDKLATALDSFEALGKKAKGPLGLNAAERGNFERAKSFLAYAIARAREPGGKLTDADVEIAKNDLPDAIGAIDMFTFDGEVKNLRQMLLGLGGGEDTRSDTDILRQYLAPGTGAGKPLVLPPAPRR